MHICVLSPIVVVATAAAAVAVGPYGVEVVVVVAALADSGCHLKSKINNC